MQTFCALLIKFFQRICLTRHQDMQNNATDMQLLRVKTLSCYIENSTLNQHSTSLVYVTTIYVGIVMVHSTLPPFHKYWYTNLIFTVPFFISRCLHFLASPVSSLHLISLPLSIHPIFFHFELLFLPYLSVLPFSLKNFRVETTPNIFVRCIHFL